VKNKIIIFSVISILLVSCATYQPPPPHFYFEGLPPVFVTDLSLDERIQIEEAWSYIREGRAKKAKDSLIKLGEEHPFYYVGMGYVFYLLHDIAMAEDYFNAALQEHPDMSLIHLGLGQIYMETEREDLAFSEFREILKSEPDHQWVKPKYEALKKRKTDDALIEGRTYFEVGNIEKSKEAFLEALFFSPESSEAHMALAKIFHKENRLKNTLIHLEAAYSADPDNIEIKTYYAEILFQVQKYAQSLDLYQELLDIEPDNSKFKERIATLKNRLGIFELPDEYNIIPTVEAVSKEQIAALIFEKFKAQIGTVRQKPPIIIDIATSWASKYILKMATLGILDVYPNHEFQPKKIIKRSEMAEILIRLIHYLKDKGYPFIQHIPPESIEISDVSPDNYYYRPILLILSYDIMNLHPDRSFKPDYPVSGQEAMNYLEVISALL